MAAAPDRHELVVESRAVPAPPEVRQHGDVDAVLVLDERPGGVPDLAPADDATTVFRNEPRLEVLLRIPGVVPVPPLRQALAVVRIGRPVDRYDRLIVGRRERAE